MSADLPATEQNEPSHTQFAAQPAEREHAAGQPMQQDQEEESEEEDDDEPKLKYAKLTGSLTNVYRNGDSTSAFTVAGDKMVLGTHNGNIHVLSLPPLQSLKTYHAHSATITSVSVSPVPPPPSLAAPTEGHGTSTAGFLSPPASPRGQPTTGPRNPQTKSAQQAPAIPNTPNNQIYIATSSLDGHVCIYSLLDSKDIQLRNFARPVQAVALSPSYKSDRTYLSGGLAGQLILTVGGKAGVTTDANTNSAAAAASGWLGSIGLGGGDRGKDTVLHSGEGAIGEIKWSLSGKWVVWVNEEGIKIMRSHLKLGSENEEDAWRRIAHAAKPNRRSWEGMAGVWRARATWIDEKKVEADDDASEDGGVTESRKKEVVVNGASSSPSKKSKTKKVEKLIVGWGDTAWILHVHEGGTGAGGKRHVGSADIERKLQFQDCIVSGISLYTPSLLAILAYRTRDDDDKPIQQQNTKDTTPRKGRHHRQNGLAPQLRLVKVVSGEEVDLDELSISRFETLSAQDYHLGTLWIPPPPAAAHKVGTADTDHRGAFEGLWDAAGGKYATRMFSSSASVLSRSTNGKEENGKASFASPTSSAVGVAAPSSVVAKKRTDAHPHAAAPGLKLFIQSPYDCVLAIKRDLGDHLEWLLERKQCAEAWTLVDEHPEIVADSSTEARSIASPPSTPSKAQGHGGSLAEFFADDSTISTDGGRAHNSAVEKEKRRIGELWLQQLISANDWTEAGRVAGKVLGRSSSWEHWIWSFAQADKFDEITPYIPYPTQVDIGGGPRLPGMVYELVLGHYVPIDVGRLRELLELWDPNMGLYDVGSVSAAIENRLQSGEADVEEGSEEWRILVECLAKLYLAEGRAREALRCYIQTQNADAAMALIKEEKLMDVIADDVPGLLMLKVSKQMMQEGSLKELEEASEEAAKVLVEEAHRGSVMPQTVIRQLEQKGPSFRPLLFFYLRALWNGTKAPQETTAKFPWHRHGKSDRYNNEGHALVEDHADLAVELFAQYDRDLLMEFLRASEVYSYDKAVALCENMHYIPELVYVLSKTGQTKKALSLIIGELGDVSQAIAFAKENPDLWDDLLDYSMNRPSFIRGLLAEVGTAVDPIQLVRRIPEKLEIEGLKDGIAKMMREYDIHLSISEGVARVLRGEVGMGMDTLRAGQRKGVRFEVMHESENEVDWTVKDPPTKVEGAEALPVPKQKGEKPEAKNSVQPGHCVGCGEVFHEDERETLLGFACGHVYHLSCLLKANPDTSDPETISRLLSQLGYGATEDEGYSGRSVGAKVAHAHIISNIVKGGCRVCVVPDDA